jgi:hypothetical protein
MTKPGKTLLALIAAGQSAHRALLRPLIERGLAAGDDAVLLLLGEGVASEADLEAGTGTDIEQLRPRLDRLITREMIVRTAAGLALTDRGARLRERLLAVWNETELALTGGLKKKQRKRLARLLLEFADHLAGRGGAS